MKKAIKSSTHLIWVFFALLGSDAFHMGWKCLSFCFRKTKVTTYKWDEETRKRRREEIICN